GRTLAYLAGPLVSRLPLHSTGRQPCGSRSALPQPDARIHRERPLARGTGLRRGLDLSGVGCAERRLPVCWLGNPAAVGTHRRAPSAGVGKLALERAARAPDLPPDRDQLGLLPGEVLARRVADPAQDRLPAAGDA